MFTTNGTSIKKTLRFKAVILPCKKCQGRCCRPPIFLGKIDIIKLKGVRRKFKFVEAKIAGFDIVAEGMCPFFQENIGCTLKKNIKPIDCILFPLSYREKEGRFKFYLNNLCPFTTEFPESWIIETKRWARRHLKEWSDLERKAYLERQK